jgi:predicted acetyltransferase
MPELISPASDLRRSWLASRDEWGRGVHQDGAGLHSDDDVDTPAGFSAWIERLLRQADASIPAGEGHVHATYWWVVEDNTYLGVSIRKSCGRVAGAYYSSRRS